jgi:hypothetical protein
LNNNSIFRYNPTFINGITQAVTLLLVVIIAGLLTWPFKSKDVFVAVGSATGFIGWLIAGYFYKKKYGSIVRAEDGNGLNRIFNYLMGVGLIWGPLKFIVFGFPHDVLPIFNAALLLLVILMTGLSISGLIIIGGSFYKNRP